MTCECRELGFVCYCADEDDVYNAMAWADDLEGDWVGIPRIRALVAEIRRLREEVAVLETSEGFFNEVIQAAQKFVHARCKAHTLYRGGVYCGACGDVYVKAEDELRKAVEKMEAV